MPLNNMNMGEFNSNQARENLNNRTMSPDFAPGMGTPPAGTPFATPPVGVPAGGNPFSQGNPFANPTQTLGGVNPMGTPFASNSPFSTTPTMPMGNMMPQQPVKSTEDKIWDVLKACGSGLVNMVKDIIDSFHGLTGRFWQRYGFKLTIEGVALMVIGAFTKLLHFKDGWLVAIGGATIAIPGVLFWLLNSSKASNNMSEYEEETPTQEVPSTPPFNSPEPSDWDNTNSSWGDSGEENWNDSDDGEEDYYEEEEEEDYGDEWNAADISAGASDGMDAEAALASVADVPKGVYTRQFLYENFIKVLPTYSPKYADFHKYDEDSDSFLFWSDLVMQAGELQGFDEENYPYLMELSENAFIIKAKTSRNAKLKPALMAEELAKAYAYNMYPTDQEKRAGVFATVDTILNTCVFTIFTGNCPMISVKDIYKSCEDFVLSRDVTMPIILGVNELGTPIKLDFKSVESLITAGMPRSGKSWLAQSILTQLCALNSPRDVNIYFLDPKAATSDYFQFKLPHVKGFASQYRDQMGNVVNPEFPSILGVLRYLVNKEAPRRKKILGQSGCINIKDYRGKYPDANLPYIYVIIDEMVTLSAMLKEDETEYQTYLDQIVTQFPNLGIRGMFVPHEVKNQIMSKTASDSVKARISVKGSESHIEQSTGTKPSQFKYKLPNVGDMAVRIDEVSSSTVYTHAAVLTDHNDKNIEVFKYLARLWLKLDPDSFTDSVAKDIEADRANQSMLNDVNSDDFLEDLDDVDLFS